MEKKAKKIAIEVGVGIAAAGAAAAAAGYYFYGSAKAKNHRKIAAKWAMEMKSEVVKEAKRLEKAGPKTIAAIVDRVAKTYRAVRSTDLEEVRRAADELKENWKMVERETRRTARKSVVRAKAAVKRVK